MSDAGLPITGEGEMLTGALVGAVLYAATAGPGDLSMLADQVKIFRDAEAEWCVDFSGQFALDSDQVGNVVTLIRLRHIVEAVGINSGFFTPEEVRRWEGLTSAPVADGEPAPVVAPGISTQGRGRAPRIGTMRPPRVSQHCVDRSIVPTLSTVSGRSHAQPSSNHGRSARRGHRSVPKSRH